MKLRNVLIGCAIVLVILCIGGIVGYLVILKPAAEAVINTFAAPITTSNDFMTALIAKDYPKAYGMVIPDQQAAFGGSADGMKQMFGEKQLEPSTYTFSNINIGTDAVVNGTGTFSGNTKYVYINLRKDGDTWKILGLQVNDNAPTATAAAN